MYTSSKRCTAHVTLKHGRVKEYGNRAVYLKDNQEFEIELFNPHTRSVMAKIYINGIQISGGGLVVRPGQRTFLERYLDDNRKFKFDTYTVEGTRESVEAIAKNGELRIEFFYEKDPPLPYYNGTITISNPWINPGPFPKPYYYDWNCRVGGESARGMNINSLYCSNTAGNTLNLDGLVTNCSSSTTTDFTFNPDVYKQAAFQSKAAPVETGRVEKGAISEQALTTVYEEFNSWWSEEVSMKILPFSQKPHEISELRQYCTSCSTRIKKSSWKFCPSCGATLEA